MRSAAGYCKRSRVLGVLASPRTRQESAAWRAATAHRAVLLLVASLSSSLFLRSYRALSSGDAVVLTQQCCRYRPRQSPGARRAALRRRCRVRTDVVSVKYHVAVRGRRGWLVALVRNKGRASAGKSGCTIGCTIAPGYGINLASKPAFATPFSGWAMG